MKFSNRILLPVTAFLAACSLGLVTASADVFHGHWIGGRIEETYSLRTLNVPNLDSAFALPDAEVVDTEDYQLSEDMDRVPLFPAGTSPEEIEAALQGGSMPTSFPTILENETPTSSDTTTDRQPDPVQVTQGIEDRAQ